MHPTTDLKEADPNDVLTSHADKELAHAYQQIRSADEQLARVSDQLSRLERETAPSRRRAWVDKPWLRGIVGLLLAVCIIAVAFVSQPSHADRIAPWVPKLASALAGPLQKLGLGPPSPPSSVQLAAADRPAAAQLASHEGAALSASTPVDSEQLLQKVARDVANIQRELEQLNSSQQQFAVANERALEQIKASQEQAVHDSAKGADLSVARSMSGSSEQGSKPAVTDTKTRTTLDQVTAATAVAERVTAATAVAILMARPEIRSVSDLTGRTVAIDESLSATVNNVRIAMAAAGATQIQLTVTRAKAIDRIIAGEVPASVLTLASPDAAEGFPDISGFKIFRIPLSHDSIRPASTSGKRSP